MASKRAQARRATVQGVDTRSHGRGKCSRTASQRLARTIVHIAPLKGIEVKVTMPINPKLGSTGNIHELIPVPKFEFSPFPGNLIKYLGFQPNPYRENVEGNHPNISGKPDSYQTPP